MMVERAFGDAGARIVIEEHLSGREASFFVLLRRPEVRRSRALPGLQAGHGRRRRADTGGMARTRRRRTSTERSATRSSRCGRADDRRAGRRRDPVLRRAVRGLMLTADGPKVSSTTAASGIRSPGAPAAPARRLGRGPGGVRVRNLRGVKLSWRAMLPCASCWPREAIQGSTRAPRDLRTRRCRTGRGRWCSRRDRPGSGRPAAHRRGRVLGVTALGSDLRAARDRAYSAASRIRWSGMHHRTDIALDAIGRTS